MDYIYFNWEKIYFQCLDLAKIIKTDNFSPDIILGIARGGLIIARLLSDFLRIKEIAALQLEFYKNLAQKKTSPKLINDISSNLKNRTVLLCDDVVDTGESMIYILNFLKNKGCKYIKIATLHKKSHSKFIPDYFIEEIDFWIIYPWELNEILQSLQKSIKNISDIKKKLIALGVESKKIKRLLDLT